MSVDYNFKVVKNAKVEVVIKPVKNDSYSLAIIINNGQYIHEFPTNAKENKLIYLMEPKAISAKFTGGTYVFLDDKLIDYRTGDYIGFIHSEDGIKNLAEKIGCESRKYNFRNPVSGLFQGFRESKNEVFLGGVGQEFSLDIASLAEGGSFRNKLIHKWSPFSSNIITSLEVERLVCNNGMVGLSPFVTNKIPIINDWERNLRIVSTGLIPTYQDILKHRFTEMTDTQASIYDVQKATELLNIRKENTSIEDILNGKKQSSNTNLNALLEHLNVSKRLGDIYQPEVFIDDKKSKLAASDLSLYDVFNILTEGCTHTLGSADSNSNIQREINRIVFDELNNKKKVATEVPKISQESDHRRVFFGKK